MPATLRMLHTRKIAPDDMKTHTKIFKDYTDLTECENKSRVPLGLKDALAVRLDPGFSTMSTDNLYEWTRKYVEPSWDVERAGSRARELSPGKSKPYTAILLSTDQGPPVTDSYAIVRDFTGETVPENPQLPYRTGYCWHSVKDTLHDSSTKRTIQKISMFGVDGTFTKFEYLGALQDRLLVEKKEEQGWVTEYTDPQGEKVTTLDQFPAEIAGPVKKWIEEHSKPLSEQLATDQSSSQAFSSNVTVGGFHKSLQSPL